MKTVQFFQAFLVVNKNEPVSMMDKLNIFTNEKSAEEFMEDNEFLSDDGALVIVPVDMMVPINHGQPNQRVYFDWTDSIKKKDSEPQERSRLEELREQYIMLEPNGESYTEYVQRKALLNLQIEEEERKQAHKGLPIHKSVLVSAKKPKKKNITPDLAYLEETYFNYPEAKLPLQYVQGADEPDLNEIG